MNSIPLTQILVLPTRQRRDFPPEEHQELVESIQSLGLLNAIVLRPPGAEEPKELPYVLSSGERRYRAISDLAELGSSIRHSNEEVALGEIPFTLLGDLPPLERELAELDENLKRLDLSMQERAAATSRIVDLRREQAILSGSPAPTHTFLAEALFEPTHDGGSRSTSMASEKLRKQLLVARNLDDPEVAKAKTLDEAFKHLKRKATSQRNSALAASIGPTYGAHSHTALQVDALKWLAEAPSESFDVILTDPIYGMGADEFGDAGGRTGGEHNYQDDYETWKNHMDVLSRHGFRVCKPQAHIYAFCDIDNFGMMKDIFAAESWWVHRTPLIWYKPSAPRIPWPEHGPQRKYELILYAVKGKKPITKIAPDVITMNPDTNLGHMAQKPVGLFQNLLSRSCKPGDSVLDPFMGTGPIFPAAHELKLRATGLEIDAASYGIAVKRLEGLK